jgi:hypothetical protein
MLLPRIIMFKKRKINARAASPLRSTKNIFKTSLVNIKPHHASAVAKLRSNAEVAMISEIFFDSFARS